MNTIEALLLTDEFKKNLINQLIKKLEENYVFPEVALTINEKLVEFTKGEKFALLSAPEEFCTSISQILQSVNHDRHLALHFLEHSKKEESNDEDQFEMEEGTWLNNFGFAKCEILPGNVGYLKLNIFDLPHLAGDTAVATMNFLVNTSGLIIDLRENGGGDPDMVNILMSYFFETDIHHTTFYNRAENKEIQFWTMSYVPGKKYLEKPVRVLTSKYTFSAAESFAYNLKHLNRAKIVGENTGGGAQPGRPHILHPQFEVFISHGRAVSTVTNTNWEGVGVEPDTLIDSKEAFDKAYEDILSGLLDSEEYCLHKPLKVEAEKQLNKLNKMFGII
ncbi:S41 family peptidase [Bacillus sp. 31A1R]|uniref:S41 family peptidase n=1 Tax=Robertmurraya mangrovi TaxID=3098077 RepID=A0ABU5IVZ1_9BACI|nr:S41 family peptidase [Bacillus sp. 31A1R]MDZ5471306.1 S41 family peptidase [Bacillus sp. 31A1R]